MEEQVTAALEVLKRGGIILYPTDTIWGIGCDATNVAAVERIYALKRRADKMSMIVLIESLENLGRYVRQIPELTDELFAAATSPLTLILPQGVGVAANLLPPQKSIAIRIPDHAFCTALLRKFHRPLVSTSANISGHAAPLRYEDISAEIINGVDLVIDPMMAKGSTGKASSIIRLGMTGQIEIVRH